MGLLGRPSFPVFLQAARGGRYLAVLVRLMHGQTWRCGAFVRGLWACWRRPPGRRLLLLLSAAAAEEERLVDGAGSYARELPEEVFCSEYQLISQLLQLKQMYNVHNVRPVARLEDVEGQIGVDAADQTNVRLAPQHRAGGRRRRPTALAAPVPVLMGG
uniref:Uncharacterized protein n=1 Tax=Anopheles melas TaxID=34690 RepID=A0A182U713_9DIPT